MFLAFGIVFAVLGLLLLLSVGIPVLWLGVVLLVLGAVQAFLAARGRVRV